MATIAVTADAIRRKEFLKAVEHLDRLVNRFDQSRVHKDYEFLRMYLLVKAGDKTRVRDLAEAYIDRNVPGKESRAAEVKTFLRWVDSLD